MEIQKIKSGPCDNNTYLIMGEKEACLIDASCSVSEIEKHLQGKKLCGVVLTHGHYDHFANLDNIVNKFGIKCYLSKEAYDKIKNSATNCSYIFGLDYVSNLPKNCFVFIEDEEKIDISQEISAVFYRTPGHTDCGVCIKFEDDKLFTGDTLFNGTIGRTDLPTSSSEQMRKSLKYLFDNFKNCHIYPGHGSDTVI